MKPDERAQHRWPPVSGAATPPLPHIGSMGRPATPFMTSDRSARIPDCRSETERSAYPVDLSVSRETCSPLRWYSISTVRTPLYRLLRRPHAPMRRQMHSQSKRTSRVVCCTAPCPTLTIGTCIRSMTDFCSSRRNVCGTFASYSSLGDERYLPRGRPEHPVPARQDRPCVHWRAVHRPNQYENGPSATRRGFT